MKVLKILKTSIYLFILELDCSENDKGGSFAAMKASTCSALFPVVHSVSYYVLCYPLQSVKLNICKNTVSSGKARKNIV